MALREIRLFCLLFFLIVVLFISSQRYLSTSHSWIALAKVTTYKSEAKDYDWDIKWLNETGNLTLPPVVLANVTENPESTEDIPVEKEENAHMTTVTVAVTTGPVTPETPMPPLSVKDFKTYPRWDFDDQYNQDAPPRQTKCTESLRNSQDEGFQKAFLPNIRLYLHKDNFNMSEWNRLSHFNNPFGFMGYKYEEVMDSLRLIPKPEEPLLHPLPGSGGCVRCAVVGTSGILNGSRMGEEIDSHDYVFRVNSAVVRGFEEDVGNRTSVYVHTAFSIYASLAIFRKFGSTSAPNDKGIKYVLIPEGLRDFKWLSGLFKGEQCPPGDFHSERPRKYYGGQYSENNFYVLHQDFLRYVRNRFLLSASLNSTYWPIVRPTNGAFAVLLALHVCDTVSAYGFITEDHSKYSNYYYEKKKNKVIFYGNHDYHLEKNLWKKLHNSKIMKFYQRTEPETSNAK